MRFFLNVPAFLMLAALMLAWVGIGANAHTRWHPGVLAATHLVVLGVLSSAMLGAVMQILPVATHIHVLHSRISSVVIHTTLVLGVLSLATGFLTGGHGWHIAAVVLLAIAFATFFGAVIGGLIRGWSQRSPGSGEILVAVRLALAALIITIGLGIFLAGLRAGLWSPNIWQRGEWLPGLPDLHVLWGLAGWVGLLVVGVSYQVIPIFQATEIYPRRLTDHLAPLVFGLMLVVTATSLSAAGSTGSVAARLAGAAAAALLSLAYLTYGGVTAWLLWTRKRPSPEPTTWFWFTAMGSFIATALLAFFYPWLIGDDAAGKNAVQMLMGTLFILGFAVSAVNGMLYKIIPFLLWHNAQRRAPMALPFMPKVRHFIAERDALRQYVVHLVAVLLLAAACLLPSLLVLGAIALGASAGLLSWNMARALQLYLGTCSRIRETLKKSATSVAEARPD